MYFLRPDSQSLRLFFAAAALSGCMEPRSFLPTDNGPRGDSDASSVVMDVPSGTTDVAMPPRDVPTGPVDVPVIIDPDAACGAVESVAQITRQPVDIIWVVDNSTSMEPSIREVTNGLNAFANRIGMRMLDYRVIMLSLRSAVNPVMIPAGRRFGVCIPMPLAGDANCGNGARFFQSSIDIRSTQPLEQLLGSLGQTAGYSAGQDRGGEPWRQWLRPTASKTIVVVTDDESRMPANEFEHFAGGVNPRSGSFTLPPGLLDPSWGGLFTGYTFSGLYGWNSEVDPNMRCTYPGGTQPPSAGPTYTTLIQRTRGARAKICDGAAAWSPFFDRVATAVETSSRLACDLAIPDPPMGMVFDGNRVNVLIEGSGMTQRPGRVANMAACGAAGGWYYDDPANPHRIFLCQSSCDAAQAAVRAGAMRAVRVLYGCLTVPG